MLALFGSGSGTLPVSQALEAAANAAATTSARQLPIDRETVRADAEEFEFEWAMWVSGVPIPGRSVKCPSRLFDLALYRALGSSPR